MASKRKTSSAKRTNAASKKARANSKKKELRAKKLASLSPKAKREFLKRSRASKKGWAKKKVAKKLSDTQKKLKNAQKGIPKKKRKPIPRLPAKKKRTVEELEQLLRMKEQEIEVLQMTQDWVHAMPDAYIKRDGTIALQPSRLRHLPLEVYEEVLRDLRKWRKKGDIEFGRRCQFYADYFDVPLREVYTLYHSN